MQVRSYIMYNTIGIRHEIYKKFLQIKTSNQQKQVTYSGPKFCEFINRFLYPKPMQTNISCKENFFYILTLSICYLFLHLQCFKFTLCMLSCIIKMFICDLIEFLILDFECQSNKYYICFSL